jgi:ribosomal protein S18 acetylase RimI-like enzyme
MTFRTLSAQADPSREIVNALPWVQAAGRPYVDWLLGGHAATRRILEQWMARPSSEVFIGRAIVVEEGCPVGGFIALIGAELARCRIEDAVAAVAAAPHERRASLVARLRLGRGLFGDVLPDDFYLSRMGVLPHARGRGYGKALVREYLRQGMERRCGRFALDVSSRNHAAIELYRSVGFVPQRCDRISEVPMTYVRMVLGMSSASRERPDAMVVGDSPSSRLIRDLPAEIAARRSRSKESPHSL